MKIKLYLTSGGILYANDTMDNLRILMNSSNNGRTVVYDAYKEETFATKVVLSLINLEYFEAI